MKNLLLLAVMTCVNQQAFSEAQHDPYAAIRYNSAFDQEDLYRTMPFQSQKSDLID